MSEEIGRVEVIVGSMFSGKTEELIRRLRRAQLARLAVQVFKPRIDQRYARDFVASHNQVFFPSVMLEDPREVWQHLQPQTRVVGFDEGQFFSENLIDVCQQLADQGLRVIVAGLDTDWLGEPFEPMPALMAIAETVDKPQAVCMVCGEAASRTQKLFPPDVDSEPQTADSNRNLGGEALRVQVGGRSEYEARCRKHFVPRLDHATAEVPWFHPLTKESLMPKTASVEAEA